MMKSFMTLSVIMLIMFCCGFIELISFYIISRASFVAVSMFFRRISLRASLCRVIESKVLEMVSRKMGICDFSRAMMAFLTIDILVRRSAEMGLVAWSCGGIDS